MKVSQAIRMLKELEPGDDIILAWWEHDSFSDHVDAEDWPDTADWVEDKMSWSDAHDQMVDIINEGD